MTIAKHSFTGQRIDSVVDRVAALYERKGLRFTELRRLVLEVLAEHHIPVGAYTIIHVLESRYRKLSPISVYRALDSLIKMGVVNKVRTQNAYFIAECYRTRTKQSVGARLYLICDVCNRVTEAASPAAYDLIEQASRSALFKLSVKNVEVSGTCDDCLEARSKSAGARKRAG